MGSKIKFGHRKMERAFKDFTDDILGDVKKVVEDTALLIQTELKTRAPSDGGYLQESIELTMLDGGLTAKIKIGAFYAINVCRPCW